MRAGRARLGVLGLGRQALGSWGGRRWGAQGERARGALASARQVKRHALARGAGGSGRAAGRTGARRWALGAGARACAAGAGSVRGIGRQGACLVCWLGQLGARALDLIFKPVFRLGIFPESPNEHCSL